MAAITSYTTLKTAITDYLAKSSIDSWVPNFIQNCESKVYKSVRIRDMETALSDTIASGVIEVPSDYLELRYAYVDASPVTLLERTTPEIIYAKYPTRTGANIPCMIAREGSNFIFGPYPGAYDIAGIYYAKYDSLSDSNQTNWFITNAPDVLLYGSLLEAEPFLKNDVRIDLWRSMYLNALQIVKDSETDERHSGSPLAIQT